MLFKKFTAGKEAYGSDEAPKADEKQLDNVCFTHEHKDFRKLI